MPLDRLYVNVINNVTNEKNLILTSKLLVYKTKENVELYPYIHSSSKYKYSEIAQLPYDEIIVFFFNKEKFKLYLETPDNNEFNKKILNDNFEFTITTLFSPYMSFASYRQSMSYYDRRFIPSFPKMSVKSFFKNKYYYVNINNTLYTINSNIWLNDALNIPSYRKIIQDYNKAQSEIKMIDDLQAENDKNIDILLNLISLDFVFNYENLDTISRNSDKRNISISDTNEYINNSLDAIITEFKNNIYPNLMFLRRYGLEDNNLTFQNVNNYKLRDEVKQFLDSNNAVSNTLKHSRKKRFQMFLEFIIKNQNMVEQTKYSNIKNNVNKFIKEISQPNNLKDLLLNFIKSNKTESFNKIELKFFLQFKEQFVELENELNKIEVFNFVKSGGKQKNNELKTDYLKKQFPNFNNFINSMVEMGEKKKFSNNEWQKTYDIYINKYSSYKSDDNENMFEYITTCLNNNANCKNSLKPAKYIHFTLDSLNNIKYKELYNDDISTVYESYIRLNLIKGKLDKTSFKKISCEYYNNNKQLSNEPSHSNELLNNNFMEDFEEIIKISDKKKTNKDTKPNDSIKKGGKKKNSTKKVKKKKINKSNRKIKTKRRAYK
jgi:hypothetical protein